MDVTPLVSKGRQLIESYGDGAFKISGVVYTAPVIVFPESCFSPENFEADKVISDYCGKFSKRSIAHQYCFMELEKILSLIPEIEKEFVRQQNCVLDIMNTGAACRTFNVLCAEDRRVAAVLFPVD